MNIYPFSANSTEYNMYLYWTEDLHVLRDGYALDGDEGGGQGPLRHQHAEGEQNTH